MSDRGAGRTPTARIQGDDLIGEVLRNMEDGLFRMRRKMLVPSIYRVYLNPRDFEPFRDVTPFIAGEIRSALEERMARWNKSKRRLAQSVLEKLGVGETIEALEFVRAGNAWTVEIYPDLDDKLQPGEIEVCSELSAPEKTEYGSGSVTRRIFPQRANEPDEAPTVATAAPVAPSVAEDAREEERAPAPSAPVAAVPQAPRPVETAPQETHEEEGTKPRAFAYLRYTDQQGPKTFEVTKNQMVIGRGGRSYWVDLKLETLPDVSREHCRIRRDPETRRFTIEDVSQFGTAVNGKPVGQNASAELPRRATISLAGVVDLQWEAL